VEIDVTALQMLPAADEPTGDVNCCASYVSIICTGTFDQSASLADSYGEIRS
jgi:hypothetical protein